MRNFNLKTPKQSWIGLKAIWILKLNDNLIVEMFKTEIENKYSDTIKIVLSFEVFID